MSKECLITRLHATVDGVLPKLGYIIVTAKGGQAVQSNRFGIGVGKDSPLVINILKGKLYSDSSLTTELQSPINCTSGNYYTYYYFAEGDEVTIEFEKYKYSNFLCSAINKECLLSDFAWSDVLKSFDIPYVKLVSGAVEDFVKVQCSIRTTGNLSINLNLCPNVTLHEKAVNTTIYVNYNSNGAVVSSDQEGTTVLATYTKATDTWVYNS